MGATFNLDLDPTQVTRMEAILGPKEGWAVESVLEGLLAEIDRLGLEIEAQLGGRVEQEG
jgi:hypothetical protein